MMELRPEALNQEGYITDQRKTDNIPFGLCNSDRNGCGWIACYNLLKALERDPDPERLVKDLERTLLLGGLLGANVFALVWELRRQRVPLNFALRPIHAQRLCETAPGGIILYRAGKSNHFAAFRREEDGRLRFYGAVPGQEKTMSLAAFRWDYVKFPLMLVLTAGE